MSTLIVTHRLHLDLTKNSYRPVVPAVQGEANTRRLAVSLFINGSPWKIPSGASAAVAFRKPDGTKGLYTKLPDGTPATTLSGNTVEAILAPQALTCAGPVVASIVFYNAAMNTLATFPFQIRVEANPAAGADPSDDYYAMGLEQLNSAYADLLDRVQELEQGGDPDEQYGELIGDLGALETESKESLVAAINEVAGKAGSGTAGRDGGYYSPLLTQIDDNTVEISFVRSDSSMMPLKPKTVTLPSGKDGDDYILTDKDKQEIADMIPIPEMPGGDSAAYTDVTEDYNTALGDGTVTCAREFLWALGEGRWSLVEGDEKYYLNVFVGNFSAAPANRPQRILIRCYDFLYIEVYPNGGRYDDQPYLMLDGETGEVFSMGSVCNPTDLLLRDGRLYLSLNEGRFGKGVELPTGDEWELIGDITLEEDSQSVVFSGDTNGKAFSLKKLYAVMSIKFVTTEGADVDKTYTTYKGCIRLNGGVNYSPFYKEVSLYHSGGSFGKWHSVMYLESYGTDGSFQGWLNDSCDYVSNRKLGFQTTGSDLKLPEGITQLKISPSNTSHVLAAETKITLYGVRK